MLFLKYGLDNRQSFLFVSSVSREQVSFILYTTHVSFLQ